MRKTFWGLVMIVLGSMALLQGIGQYHFGLTFWPVVWALIGLSILFESFRKVSWFGMALGLWLSGIGILDILNNAGLTDLKHDVVVRMGWPVLLIAIGLSVLFGRRSWMRFVWGGGRRGRGRDWKWERGAGETKVIGDMRYGYGAWTLDGDLHLNHGVGDLKVDLSSATITDGEHRIHLDAGIGEMVVRVPDNVNCTVRASAGIGEIYVFGDNRSGISLSLEKTITVPDATATLHITAEMGVGSMRISHVPAQIPRLVL